MSHMGALLDALRLRLSSSSSSFIRPNLSFFTPGVPQGSILEHLLLFFYHLPPSPGNIFCKNIPSYTDNTQVYLSSWPQ